MFLMGIDAILVDSDTYSMPQEGVYTKKRVTTTQPSTGMSGVTFITATSLRSPLVVYMQNAWNNVVFNREEH
jgi:hypothetical protein